VGLVAGLVVDLVVSGCLGFFGRVAFVTVV